MFRFQHPAMATQFEIRCTHADEAYARQAARMGFEAVDRLEQQLSRFVENSDISRINHLSAGEETRVSLETMECLRLARLLYEETGGAFDPAIGSGFDRLELLAGEFVVRAGTDGIQLDLGAIGKGRAVDRVAEVLEEWDVSQALIDAGYSSVLALDPPAGRGGWPLTLSLPELADARVDVAPYAPREPARPARTRRAARGQVGRPVAAGGVFARIAARQQALGASGIRKGDHIRDPHTGTPVRARQAAWVSGPREVLGEISRRAGAGPSPSAAADALSTAFMILPAEQIDQYCQAHRLEAWILEGDIRHFPVGGPSGPP